MADHNKLVLGSASPRRADLLSEMGVDFVVHSVEIDEDALILNQHDAAGGQSAARIAQAKFAALSSPLDPSTMLLTADTLVSCRGAVLGKPASDEALTAMLREMSSAEIEVTTALCVGPVDSEPTPVVVTTAVQLHTLSESQIGAYVASGTGRDKAGGLALQSEANKFVVSVRGCWSNVLGLPKCAVAQALDLDATGRGRRERCSVSLCGDVGR